jgi:methionyl-tRNA formyltransferase
MNVDQYLVAGCRPWSRQVFDEVICHLSGQWVFAETKDILTADYVRRLNPRYVFFLHWSWIVPHEITNTYECVGFHMTDLPYGRGGSPLQNLILRGHRDTKLTAIRMTNEVDAGPVYFKEDLSLEGSAQEIYLRANRLAARMIERIIREQPQPKPQSGQVVTFKRRRPAESEIRRIKSLDALYDFIRMLDADGYPRAFIQRDGFRFEFSRAQLLDGRLKAAVTITPVDEAKS